MQTVKIFDAEAPTRSPDGEVGPYFFWLGSDHELDSDLDDDTDADEGVFGLDRDGGNADMTDIQMILAQRGDNYGDFIDNAAIAVALKDVVYSRTTTMKPDVRQAINVIFDKIARMCTGNSEYDDNWRDIVGYATLVLDRMEDEQETSTAASKKAEPVALDAGSTTPANNPYGLSNQAS